MPSSPNATAGRESAVKKLHKFFFALLVLPIILPACQQPPETSESVLQKIIAAHGSPEKLRRIEGMLLHGRIQALLKNEVGELWILYQRPDRLRVVLEMPGGREERLLVGERGWRDVGPGFEAIEGLPVSLMHFQAEHLDLPWRLLQGNYRVNLIAPMEEGEPVRLELVDADGTETRVTVDSQSWLIHSVERDFVVDDQDVRLKVVYDTYRLVKGVQLPLRMRNLLNEQLVGRSEFTTVQIDPALPQTVFTEPSGQEEIKKE